MAMVSADMNGEIRIWEKDEGTLLRVFESARKMKPTKNGGKEEKAQSRFTDQDCGC
jgi:hypothetical protein